jgi:opacity protein-like surface antigen
MRRFATLFALGLAVAAAVLGAPRPAAARPASTGWFAEGGLGAVAFLPKASSDAAIGPALDFRIGRDLFSWLSIGISLAASSHEATVPPPPEGEWFQLYRGAGDARLRVRLDRLTLFVEGGAGLAMISSNVLGKVMITDPGERFSIAFDAGAGAEYQLENRHYAIGLAADGFLLPQFDAIRAIDSRLYLRYTY